METIYAAEYGGALADHLPMSLVALARMGADSARRGAFARTYTAAKNLRPLAHDDPEFLARSALRERLAREGRPAVLRELLAERAQGIGAGAFHALIRVAYGIVDDDDAEIAAGLIYWGHAALDLGAAPEPSAEPFDAFAALERARERLGSITFSPRGLIATRMATVARDAAFDATVGAPHFADDALAQCAALTARAFAATQDFTLLHAMTATHALRIVLPYVEDRQRFLALYWRAIVAAYASAGAPPVPAIASAGVHLPAWESLLERACESDDEHVVKAVFTAWSEDRVYANPIYRLAAARYLAV